MCAGRRRRRACPPSTCAHTHFFIKPACFLSHARDAHSNKMHADALAMALEALAVKQALLMEATARAAAAEAALRAAKAEVPPLEGARSPLQRRSGLMQAA